MNSRLQLRLLAMTIDDATPPDRRRRRNRRALERAVRIGLALVCALIVLAVLR